MIGYAFFQIWRYVHELRKGDTSYEFDLSEYPIGLVLTLDDWPDLMRSDPIDAINAGKQFADRKGVALNEEDMIPIAVANINDFENCIMRADVDMLRALIERQAIDRDSWHLASKLDKIFPPEKQPPIRPIDFSSLFHDETPWFFELYDRAIQRRNAGGEEEM